MKFPIKRLFTGEVVYEAEISAEYEGKAFSIQLGAAVRVAVKARANLSRANLSRADLIDADLSCADLSGADLSCADLSGADLSGADLSGADLSCANLSRADLSGADLSCADLSDADLFGAKDVIPAGTPNGWTCVGWLRDGWLSVRVGCRDKRLAEGREYWSGKDDRREVLAALDYVEAVARLRGWPMTAQAKAAAE